MWVAMTIVLLMVQRSWELVAKLNQLSQAESVSRLEALQARIKPHFLFNSLNTISELAATRPNEAEEAIESLAMLFRVSLESKEIYHSLRNEIKLCKRFVSLESWRVSNGVAIDWQVNVLKPDKWLVPKLLIQPLIENALKYGALGDGAEPISVHFEEDSRSLSIKLTNQIDATTVAKKGNGIAIQNIQDRLFTLYEDRFTFSQRMHDDMFYLLIKIPKKRANK